MENGEPTAEEVKDGGVQQHAKHVEEDDDSPGGHAEIPLDECGGYVLPHRSDLSRASKGGVTSPQSSHFDNWWAVADEEGGLPVPPLSAGDPSLPPIGSRWRSPLATSRGGSLNQPVGYTELDACSCSSRAFEECSRAGGDVGGELDENEQECFITLDDVDLARLAHAAAAVANGKSALDTASEETCSLGSPDIASFALPFAARLALQRRCESEEFGIISLGPAEEVPGLLGIGVVDGGSSSSRSSGRSDDGSTTASPRAPPRGVHPRDGPAGPGVDTQKAYGVGDLMGAAAKSAAWVPFGGQRQEWGPSSAADWSEVPSSCCILGGGLSGRRSAPVVRTEVLSVPAAEGQSTVESPMRDVNVVIRYNEEDSDAEDSEEEVGVLQWMPPAGGGAGAVVFTSNHQYATLPGQSVHASSIRSSRPGWNSRSTSRTSPVGEASNEGSSLLPWCGAPCDTFRNRCFTITSSAERVLGRRTIKL